MNDPGQALLQVASEQGFLGQRDEENVFAFQPGMFPVEIAPPVDHDIQFNKSIVQPINRFIEAMGFSPISSKLVTSTQLF